MRREYDKYLNEKTVGEEKRKLKLEEKGTKTRKGEERGCVREKKERMGGL